MRHIEKLAKKYGRGKNLITPSKARTLMPSNKAAVKDDIVRWIERRIENAAKEDRFCIRFTVESLPGCRSDNREYLSHVLNDAVHEFKELGFKCDYLCGGSASIGPEYLLYWYK